MTNKSLIFKVLALLILFFQFLSAKEYTFEGYDQLTNAEKRSVFSGKNQLPESEPNSLLRLLTLGIQDNEESVVVEATKMSILTISGIESRKRDGNPVALEQAVYEGFLQSFVELKNSPNATVQAILAETKILDAEVLDSLGSNLNNNQLASSVSKGVGEGEKFGDSQDVANQSKRGSNFRWFVAGLLVASLLFMLVAIRKKKKRD